MFAGMEKEGGKETRASSEIVKGGKTDEKSFIQPKLVSRREGVTQHLKTTTIHL